MDERRKIIVPGDEETTVQYAVDHFVTLAQRAIVDHGAFFVALSGGSTPKRIYAELPKYKDVVDWKRVFLFWSDERSVPPEDPESNYHMAMTSGLEKLGIPDNQIFRMHAEVDIEENAKAYEKQIRKTIGIRTFDLIMLGMGDDGHTASLFPGTKGLTVQDRLVIANEVPQKNTWRMTFTFPLINSAQAVFYVLGKNKAKPLASVFQGDSLPAARVGTREHPALWIVDNAAAIFLT